MTAPVDANTDNKTTLLWFHRIALIFLFIFIVVAIVATPLIVRTSAGPGSADAGQFGDMFGATNALFSGLAFLGVIVAILLQRQELALQRNAIIGQREEMQLQNEMFGKRQFEAVFFQMISLHHQIVNDLDTNVRRTAGRRFYEVALTRRFGQEAGKQEDETTFRGRDVFEVFYRQFGSMNCEWKDKERVDRVYEIFHQQHSADIGHYFRNLYNIVKYVDRFGGDDPWIYISVLRSQLSSFELVLLFYNCTCGIGESRFLPLVEKYALLEHMEEGLLKDASHLEWINPSATGENESLSEPAQ